MQLAYFIMKQFYTRSLLLFTSFLLLSSLSFAQAVLFSEDFQNGMPSNFTIIDNDGLSIHPNISFLQPAWIARVSFLDAADSVAMSGSWHTTSAVADNWMILPPIAITGSTYQLEWEGRAPDAAYPDGYEVYVSTTGGALSNFQAISPALTVPAENNTWTRRTVDLSSYSGQTVHIAFRNNSDDMYILMIDDIEVKQSLANDLVLTEGKHLSEYYQIPETQITTVPLSGVVTNQGTQTATNVTFYADIYHDGVLDTTVITSIPSLAPDSSHTFSSLAFIPSEGIGEYQINFTTLGAQGDQDFANNIGVDSLVITSTTYSRDKGQVISALSIGAGPGQDSELGQYYTLVNPSIIESIQYQLTQPTAGDTIWGQVRADASGTPGSILAQTEEYILTTSDTLGVTLTLDIDGGPLSLGAGEYFFSLRETNERVTIARTDKIYTPSKTMVYWNNNGAWSDVGDFNFNDPLVIRPIFSANQTPVYDLAISSITEPTEYYMTPEDHIVPLTLSMVVSNQGTSTLTNVQCQASVYQGTTLVHNRVLSIPTLLAGEDSTMTFASYTPTDTGSYSVDYFTIANESEVNYLNNDSTLTFIVTDTVYARDNGNIIGNLGIGAGPGLNSELGQFYEFVTTDYVSSITFRLNSPTAGDTIYFVVREQDPSTGNPGNVVGQTYLYLIQPDDTNGVTMTLPIFNGPLMLPPGNYFFGAKELNDNITLARTERVFTPGKMKVYWDTSPLGGWANSEDYNFFNAFYIRPNLSQPANLNYDLAITETTVPSPYTITPVSQISPVSVGVTVENQGTNTMTNVTVQAVAYFNGSVSASLTIPTPSISPGVTQTYNFPNFVPDSAGIYQIVYVVGADETEGNYLNNQDTVTFIISDSVFARDDADYIGNYSIGIAGESGIIGQNFTLLNDDDVSSVTFTLFNPPIGDSVYVSVYLTNMSSTPTTEIAVTETYTFTASDVGQVTLTLPILGGPLGLTAGEYFFGVHELNNPISLGVSEDIYTAGKGWIYYPVVFLGNFWINSNDGNGFGPGEFTYAIRPNLASSPNTGTYDLGISAANRPNSEYTRMPLAEATAFPIILSAYNYGSDTLANAAVEARVFQDGVEVYAIGDSSIMNMPPGIQNTYNFPPYTPSSIGTYTVQYTTRILEQDSDQSNDTLTYTIMITDSTFARDNDIFIGARGFGGGLNAVLGQNYTYTQSAALTSVSFYLDSPTAGDAVSVAIYTTSNDVPATIIGSTTTHIVTLLETGGAMITLPIDGGPLNLAPGTYFFGVREGAANVTLAVTNDIFTTRTGWRDWDFNATGNWVESESATFLDSTTFVIRPNTNPAIPSTDVAIIDAAYPFGRYTRIPLNQILSAADLSVLVANVGSVDVTNTLLRANIYKNDSLTASLIALGPSSLLTGDSAMVTFSSTYTPVMTGEYEIEYIVSVSEIDENPVNDTLRRYFIVTDSTFARDNDVLAGTVSINSGSGTNPRLGQNFTLSTPTRCSSISFYLDSPTPGDAVSVAVFNTSGGVPTSLITQSITPYTFTLLDASGGWFTLPLPIGSPQLAAGEYCFVVNEGVTALTLGTTDEVYTASTAWRNWTGSGGWITNESVDTEKAFMIRPNFTSSDYYDVQINAQRLYGGYTQVPLAVADTFQLSPEIRSNSTDIVTGVQVHVDLFKDGVLVFSGQSDTTSLLPGEISNLSINGVSPEATGRYLAQYAITMNEVDANSANNNDTTSVLVSDSTYARDDNYNQAEISVGSGPSAKGVLGQNYDITRTATVSSISFMLNSPTPGDFVSASIYTTSNDTPMVEIATTTVYTIALADGGGVFLTLAIDGGPITLPAGNYFVGVNEGIVDVTLAYSDFEFTYGKGWYNYDANIPDTWYKIEEIESEATFILRPNLQMYMDTICGRDVFEANDMLAIASPLPVIGVTKNARICPQGDEDWYSFSVSSDKPYIRLSLSDMPADYQLELWTSSSVLLTSTTLGLDAEIITSMLPAGDYYARVYGNGDAWHSGEGYRLLLQRQADAFAVKDSEVEEGLLQEELPFHSTYLYPNPTEGIFYLAFSTLEEMEVRLRILDIYGKRIQERTIMVGNGEHIEEMNVDGLSEGIYLIELSGQNRKEVLKLQVSH